MKSSPLTPVEKATHPDPITGEPGAHPVGTGIGAAGAGTAGAAIGMAAGGPVGAMVGAAVGAVVGGLAGKGVAESIDPTVQDAYWQEMHTREPYYDRSYSYDDYRPAYRVGYAMYPEHGKEGQTFDTAMSEVEKEYLKTKGESRLDWDKAQAAARAAWEHLEGGKANRYGD